MTEAEWLAAAEPNVLLRHMRGHVSNRKLRLFASACCHRIEHLLEEDRCRIAAEVANRFVEGRCTQAELARAYDAAVDAIGEDWGQLSEAEADVYGLAAAKLHAMRAAAFAARENPGPFGVEEGFEGSHTYAIFALSASRSNGDFVEIEEAQWQANLFRHLVGNPFHAVSIAGSTLRWNDCAVVRLAQGIYDERAFGRLPHLADVLEEAGCGNADILAHCRQAGEHVRGCWCLDLILGKT